jgi:hypothetical protein
MVGIEHLIHAGIFLTVTFYAQVRAQSAEQSQRKSGKCSPSVVGNSGCQAKRFRGDCERVTTNNF